MSIIDDLSSMKSRVDQLEIKKARIEGELKQIQEHLKELFGTTDPSKIKQKIEQLVKSQASVQEKIEKEITKLKEKLDAI